MSLKKVIFLLFSLLFTSCSVSKFIPEGEYMLNRVDIISHSRDNSASQVRSYIRQNPNSKWFSLFKVPLYMYSLSGIDSTKWVNRTLRKIGEAPVIYDSQQAELTRENIETMLHNEGYLHLYSKL